MAATGNGKHEAWRRRIAAQRASGRSIRAWCRENRLHEHTFYWWRSRLGLAPGAASQRNPWRHAEPISFAEVLVDPAAAEPFLLRLTGGRELVLPASTPVSQLAALIRALEATP